MIKKLLLALLLAVIALAVVLAAGTFNRGSRQFAVAPIEGLKVDAEAVANRLGELVRLKTLSVDGEPDAAADAFHALHALLAQRYPATHRTLKRETIGLSLLYTWPGSDPSLPALMLMAHQDVVPIAPGSEGDWKADPFGGEIRDGFVWGRGAWDDKGNLVAQMEAIEALAASGFKPRRTLYLAFGHDEEVGGLQGAAKIAATLKAAGVKLGMIVDEGMLVTEGVLKGLTPPAALVGLAEKGYLTLILTAQAAPGHSSMPGPRNAVGALAAAIAKLEAHPMPASLASPVDAMFDTLAPEMGGLNRVLLSNRWLMEPLLVRELLKTPSTAAVMRTTAAPTMLSAGNKENVLPARAQGTVNFRLRPGDTREDVIRHVTRVIDDPSVTLTVGPIEYAATRVTPPDGPGYALIARTVREVMPEAVVAPALMIAGTDSRHFDGYADEVFKFSPVRAKPEDLGRFHGTDERIAVTNLAEMVRFYHRLVQSAQELK